ncbi:MAG TPA: NAD-dependent epimerase/dehydratase family protein [Alphaproteobacteria bacterium]|nr:NAD-dependent epimerase/dehydratase family protein [Alphaproteobacteria bacterium]
MARIVVIGGSGRVGSRVCRDLHRRGHRVIALGRSRPGLDRLAPEIATAIVDLESPETVAPHLGDADIVVGCVHGHFIPAILASLDRATRPAGGAEPSLAPGPRLILLGSTWRYMKTANPAGESVRRGEAAFLASGRPGVILHCSMIYGHAGDRNVARVLGVIRRWPKWLPLLIPLPGGGKSWLQPIHIDDVVAAVAKAVDDPGVDGAPIILAGPAPLTYAELVRRCAELLDRRAWPIAIPSSVLAVLSDGLARLGLSPPLRAAEWRRAQEDKRFDVEPMRKRLGLQPRPFAAGLADSAAQYGIAPAAKH